MEHASTGAENRARDRERRYATVLKCDIVDSTRIKRRLNLDGQFELQHRYEDVVSEVATRHGGYVMRFEGDGALILFGYPSVESLEAAADSSVRMGLELVKAMRSVQATPDVRLEIRVGIASGEVGIIKRDYRTEPVEGLTIHLAERLKALAEPGGVVIAQATKVLAGGFFSYHDLGKVQVKGFDEGIQAWRVEGESPLGSRFKAQRSRNEIIGRDIALAQLSQSWSEALEGHGQTVCLVGDAGLGKSSLAREALDRAAAEGAAVIEIDCTPSTGNSPLFPIGVLLRRAANIASAASEPERRARARELVALHLPEEEVSEALRHLEPLLGLEPTPSHVEQSPDQVREETIATLVNMLCMRAKREPLALLCEDLHWADATTAEVVQRIAETTAQLRVLTIVTTRPQRGLEVPARFAKFKSIALEPLDSSTAERLVRSVAQGAELPDDMISVIVQRCEGVPLVLEEVTRNALEARSRGEGEIPAAGPGGDVPKPLELVVQSRLGRQPEIQQEIVKAASVLGREFSIRVLEEMVTQPSAEVADAIAQFADHGLLAQVSGATDRARFKHVMIWEAVYDTLLEGRRRQLHSLAADTLRADYQGTPDASAEVLAEHLRKAARFLESIKTRLAASSDTAARGAFVETEGHCEAALALIDKVQDAAEQRSLQFNLLVQLGVALTGRHGYAASQVENAYRRARAVCGETAEAAMLYPIMRALTALNLVRGNLAAGYELSLQSMELAERSNSPEFHIDAVSVHCYAVMYYRRLDECRSWITRCLALYRQYRESGRRFTYQEATQDAATAALAILPTVEWLLGDSQAAEDAIVDGLKHVEDLNRDFDKAYLHSWIAGIRSTQRRYRESAEHARKAVEISAKHGFQEWYVTGSLVGLLAEACLKASPEALAQASETCKVMKDKGVGLNASWYLWGLARGHKLAGNGPVAQYLLSEAFRCAEASAETRMNSELYILQAELESDPAKAISLLTTALNVADEQGAVANALRAAVALVLRLSGDAATLEQARKTLFLLEGGGTYPPESRWMHERLATFRAALQALPASAGGA